jgi:cytochrome c-type biogenesis protein
MKRLVLLLALAIALAAGCAKTAPGAAAATATKLPTDGPWSGDDDAVKGYADHLQNVPSVDFTLTDLNGREWKLSDLKGKTVLLNFWATWCGPCQNEMPEFQKLYERSGGDGPVVVLAVASAALEGGGAEAAKEAVSGFIDKQGFTFPVLFDADGSVWSVYQQEGIPANYILDADGNVRLLVSGAFRGGEELYAALEAVRRAESGK